MAATTPTPAQVVDSMEAMAGGTHPGYRRSGARGSHFRGTFTPTGDAAAWTIAAHLSGSPVPAAVRFSNSDGNPTAADNVPVARGLAVRFAPPGGDTDLVALSVPRFVASTPQEFLELTQVLRPERATGAPDGAKLQAWAAEHPHLADVLGQRPPIPASYATTAFWAIHAFIWVDADGRRQPVRYRWEPEAGRADLTDDAAATKTRDYLTAELRRRLRAGPVAFTLQVQLGEDDDPTHDPTLEWPPERKDVTAGRLEIVAPVDDPRRWDAQAFNPARLVPGVELSDDPVLAFRGRAYLESLRRRSTGDESTSVVW